MHRRVRELYLSVMSMAPHFATRNNTIRIKYKNKTLFPKYFSLHVSLDEKNEHLIHDLENFINNEKNNYNILKYDSRKNDVHTVNDETITYKIPSELLFNHYNNNIHFIFETHFPKNWNHAFQQIIKIVHTPPKEEEEDIYHDALFRALVHFHFYENCLLNYNNNNNAAFKRALAAGRMQKRNLENFLTVKKYRSMNKRYHWSNAFTVDEISSFYLSNHHHHQEAAALAVQGLGNRDTYGFEEE